MTGTRVEIHQGRGRCLIADKEFAVGDLIFEVQPLCAVLEEEQVQKRCAWCFVAFADVGQRCSSCKRIWYCSRGCQETDWRDHRTECRAWVSLHAERMPTRTLRLASRILTRINNGGSTGSRRRRIDANINTATSLKIGGNGSTLDGEKEAEEARREVDAMVDHNDKRTPAHADEFKAMASFVARICLAGSGKQGSALSWPSTKGRGFPGLVEAAYSLLGKISCNAFSIAEEFGVPVVGCGLYPQASTVNHSCRPGAVQVFSGRTLSLRCVRRVGKGEEITLGITDLACPGELRRTSLREGYFFECRCERCSGAKDEARLEGYQCPDPTCEGFCQAWGGMGIGGHTRQEGLGGGGDDDVGMAAGDEGLRCLKCGAVRGGGREAKREVQALRNVLEQGKALARAEGGLAKAKACLEEVLPRAQVLLHRGHWLLSELYAELVSTCLEVEDFARAAMHAREAVEVHRACYRVLLPYYPAMAHHLSITGKLLLFSGDPMGALPLLEEAVGILRVTHGERHSVYGDVRELLEHARHEGGGMPF
ncbi:unnamed protein product [Discosporangium mesarthrocarpum]